METPLTIQHVHLYAKPDTWFKEYTEVYQYIPSYDKKALITLDEYKQSVNEGGFICVRGIRICECPQSEAVSTIGEEYVDGESCHLDEFEVSLDWDETINGLKIRGFADTENICSMGRCHLDEEHFVLITDGLLIYSNIPFWTDEKYYPNSLVETWTMHPYLGDKTKPFDFRELDKIIS